MTKRTDAKTRAPATPRAASRVAPRHPHSVANLDADIDPDRAPDQPFEEGAHDAISSDLRQRMISETAYRHFAERGYADGYDTEDWLQAEAEVDHLLLGRPRS